MSRCWLLSAPQQLDPIQQTQASHHTRPLPRSAAQLTTPRKPSPTTSCTSSMGCVLGCAWLPGMGGRQVAAAQTSRRSIPHTYWPAAATVAWT
jgi:hypothetical protein